MVEETRNGRRGSGGYTYLVRGEQDAMKKIKNRLRMNVNRKLVAQLSQRLRYRAVSYG